jgi:hypothetical protein
VFREDALKKEINPGILIAAVVALALIIGFFAYRTFFTDANYTPLQGAEGDRIYSENRKKQAGHMKAGRDVPFNGGK